MLPYSSTLYRPRFGGRRRAALFVNTVSPSTWRSAPSRPIRQHRVALPTETRPQSERVGLSSKPRHKEKSRPEPGATFCH